MLVNSPVPQLIPSAQIRRIDRSAKFISVRLLLSKNTKDHYQLIEQVFSKLRQHGLKIKASKTSLFINKLIKLYGHILDLPRAMIYPTQDKISALRSKPVPTNRTALKSFLGSLVFYSQMLNLAGPQIAILHRATRGKLLKWNEESIY